MNEPTLVQATAVKPSDVYLEAWIAAEDALPADVRKLIKDHDALHTAWGEAGWPSPTPTELTEATKRVESNALANIAFTLRKQCNMAAAEERRAEMAAGLEEAA